LREGFLQQRLIEEQRAELADRNVRLDSALQASLDKVRQQAEELRASRERIVVAGDVERRRIERNLHDGAQQQLLALAVALNVAETRGAQDDEQRQLFQGLKAQAQEAMDELRDLAHGIYPPLLADYGLVVALEAQAKKAAIPVELNAEDIGRHGSEVEAAVYFSVLEALQNVRGRQPE
jgi:signal transduction histidine kinase